jgi:hypothetical protein
MRKFVNKIPIILLVVTALVAGAAMTAGCGAKTSGAQAKATTNSAYSDISLAQLIDLTNRRLVQAIEYTKLLHQDVRVTGEIGTISIGPDPSSWQVSIVVPGDQSGGSVALDMADAAFEPLVDASSSDGLKAGSSIIVEGQFVGVNKQQIPTIFVHDIIFNDTNYQRTQP